MLALREQVCDYLARRRGIVAMPDDVLIVSGTQQAFTLAAEVLLDEGDRVLLEDPHYQGARQIMQASGAQDSSAAGSMLTVSSPPNCRAGQVGKAGPRLALVTPSHQFPTGAVLSLARRMDLLAWAQAAAAG